MKNTVKNINYKLLIFSLVLLFNPSLNVVDILPDFIAWFILAKIFERAADSAPYFEEARSNFIRLGWLNLLKIPAFLLILFVKSKDTLDNNIYALVSFSFAIFEIILVTQAIKNIFTAAFYLGERTDVPTLIEPFAVSKKGNKKITTEAFKNLSYLFFILKTAFYAVPDLFLLTGVNEKGMVVVGSRYYPYVLLISVAAALAFGTVWLIHAKKYVSKIHGEDRFYSALEEIAGENAASSLELKAKLRALTFTPKIMIVAAFFSMELIFENWNNINVLPHFIYALVLLYVCYTFTKHTKTRLSLYIFGIIYFALSLASYVTSVSFLSKYEYMDLVKNPSAKAAYSAVQIMAALEFLSLAIFLIFIAKAFGAFIMKHTGVSADSERYGKLEAEFHRSLKIKNYVTMGLGILAGLTKCTNVFLNSEVQIIFSENDVITASILPWFGVLVTLSALAYIAFNFFYMATLKDEVTMKYTST